MGIIDFMIEGTKKVLNVNKFESLQKEEKKVSNLILELHLSATDVGIFLFYWRHSSLNIKKSQEDFIQNRFDVNPRRLYDKLIWIEVIDL